MRIWKDKSLVVLFCETWVSEVGTECNRRARNNVSWTNKLGEKLKKKKNSLAKCPAKGTRNYEQNADPLLFNSSCTEEKKIWMITVNKENSLKATLFSEQFLSLTEPTYRFMSCDHSGQKSNTGVFFT